MSLKRSAKKSFERTAMTGLVLAVAGLYVLELGPRLAGRFELPLELLTVRGLLPPHFEKNPGDTLSGAPAASLASALDQMGYALEPVADGVAETPRLFLAALPRDMAEIDAIDLRKSLFFRVMLPLVLKVNEDIRADRRRLIDLARRQSQGEVPSAADKAWRNNLAERYGMGNDPANTAELLRRVDVVPVSLALAQGAEESGWGTSRFARMGNALFGQWGFSETRVMVPQDRDSVVSADGTQGGIRSFGRLMDSVRAYAFNLNTHRAYRWFRSERAALRKQGTALNGYVLAGTLSEYSERGEDYVETLRTIMRANGLAGLDDARLAAPRGTIRSERDS